MSDLTPDEKTVLLIAHGGGPMALIGRWKAPTESLVAKGFLKPRPHPGDPTGHFNMYITALGQATAARCDKEDDAALGRLIELSGAAALIQNKCRAHAEQIAYQLVDLAELSAQATGDGKQDALKQWARTILERALDIMK